MKNNLTRKQYIYEVKNLFITIFIIQSFFLRRFDAFGFSHRRLQSWVVLQLFLQSSVPHRSQFSVSVSDSNEYLLNFWYYWSSYIIEFKYLIFFSSKTKTFKDTIQF